MNPTSKEMVLNTSPEAASIQTVTGWVDRHGQFWGDDERMARYAGSTHTACPDCGTPVEKTYSICSPCRNKRLEAAWHTFPKELWDEPTAVTLHNGDEFFFSKEDFLEWCCDHGLEPKTVQLVHCDPRFASEVDVDYWSDDLAEDQDLPGEILDALDVFNAAIRAHNAKGEVLSWWPNKIAVDPESFDVQASGEPT